MGVIEVIFIPRYLWGSVDRKLGDAKNFFWVVLTFIYYCLLMEINDFAILGFFSYLYSEMHGYKYT